MCSNYQPVTRSDRLLRFFGVTREKDEPSIDLWPTGLAPMIRLAEDGSGNKRVEEGIFGLLPHFAKEIAAGRRTYNARCETVATLASYRLSWKKGMRCIIPAESIYEPCYETGTAVRWRIALPFGTPMGIAGIYWPWKRQDGKMLFSFSMMTVNADGHPVMQRFHRSDEEKRMVVILRPEDYDAWLTCPVEKAAGFFQQWMEPLEAVAAPLPPRAPRAVSGKVIVPPSPPGTGDLF